MSSFNYMDGVPVKIAENYKPPPRLYQVPQAIAHRIAQASNHYEESPEFCYDFQLESKVLARMPEWRRMRQLEREARQERKEKREQQRKLELETQNKELLGAISYPSAEDLSSSESDEEPTQSVELVNADQGNLHSAPKVCNFNNILQPTVLPHNDSTNSNKATNTVLHAANVLGAGQHLNAFNYKDFEDDTSSPFDNIELKTINDLDVLAQVLHNSHLKTKSQQSTPADDHEEETKDCTEEEEKLSPNSDDSNTPCEIYCDNIHVATNTHTQADDELSLVANTKAALRGIDFSNLSEQLENENIPNSAFTTQLSQQLPQALTNNYSFQAATCGAYLDHQTPILPFNSNSEQQSQKQQPQQQQQYLTYGLQTSSYQNNQNYLYTPNCNEVSTYFSPTHATHFVGRNANTYIDSNLTASNVAFNSPQMKASVLAPKDTVEDSALKSKSVPDILKELNDELRNSKIRSFANSHAEVESRSSKKGDSNARNSSEKSDGRKADMQHYSKLERSAQKLVKNISSMGFPIDRVCKIVQIYGLDDKKVVEHLIPLSELIDLGFDEKKISDALLKFNNNKERALEYLIS